MARPLKEKAHNERIECVVGCLHCDTVIGKVFAKEREPGMWIHRPVPDPLPKHCSRCNNVIERLN